MPSPELLLRIRDGDESALAALYEELRVPLWRVAFVLARSRDIADEMLQDVLLAFWRRREQLKPDDDVKSYLFTALRNRARDHARHAKVVADTENAARHGILGHTLMGNAGPTPDRQLDAHLFTQAYHYALATLTERDRLALLLRWDEEMTFEQIAGVLSLSTVGARAVVLKAQQKVQALLAEYRT